MSSLCILICSNWVFIAKKNDIVDLYYGDRLVTEQNIPYKYDAIVLFGEWTLSWPSYYELPQIAEADIEIETLFLSLTKQPYIEEQNDPNLVFSVGGNCQSFSIYLRAALDSMGYENGFLPLSDHVCNWVIIDDVLYRMDVVTKGFAHMSLKDRKYLEEVVKNLSEIE